MTTDTRTPITPPSLLPFMSERQILALSAARMQIASDIALDPELELRNANLRYFLTGSV